MEQTISPVKRFSTILLAFAMLLGLSAVSAVALAGDQHMGQVRINKVDENGAPLAGAQLQIQDASGNVVQEFTSNGSTAEFELAPGNYQLVEVKAPEGYDAAQPINITIEEATVVQEAQVVAAAQDIPHGVVALGSNTGGLEGGYSVEWTSSNTSASTRGTVYGPKYQTFCVDASIEMSEGGADSVPLGDVKNMSRDQLLRILYVGSAGDAKGYGSQIQAGNDLDQATQWWMTTQYVVNYFTDGPAVAMDHRGKYLTANNMAIAQKMIADATDTSIVIPEGTIAYQYNKPGYNNQPLVSASFPQVQINEIVKVVPVEVTMVNQKSTIKKGKVVIKKVGTDGSDLAGAQLQIRDTAGNVVVDFTATGAPMEFELAPGDYVLHESWAPEGYEYSDDIAFSVKEVTTQTTTSSFPSGSATVRGDGANQRTSGLQFVVTDNGDNPAYCIEPWADNPPLAGATYAEADLASYNNGYSLYTGEELKQALRRIAYAGYGSDAFGKMAASGLSTYLQQDATRFAISAIAAYNYKLWDGTTNGGTLEKGQHSPSGGYPEINLVKELIAIGKDSSIQVPAEFQIKLFQAPSSSIQSVVTGYWETTTISTTIEPAEVTMVDKKTEKGKALVSKVDATGAYVSGAHLQIVDASGAVLYDFTSNGQAQEFELAAGDYILREVEAPAGYQLAAEVPFTVTATKTETIFESAAALPSGSVTVRGDNNALQWLKTANGDTAVYCLELSKKNPEASGTAYSETDFASAVNSLDSRRIYPSTPVADAIKRVLYAGYGSNATGIVSGLSDYEAQMATAIAVNYFTDYNGASNGQRYGDAVDRGQLSSNQGVNRAGKELVAVGKSGLAVPDSFQIKAYAPAQGSYQLVVAGAENKTTTTVTESEPAKVTMVDLKNIAIGTTAVDSETKDHIAYADGTVTIKDTVAYENLTVGESYTVKGELKKKSDGSTVTTGEQSFTAEAENGTVEVTFEFDGSALAGDATVAFEELYHNGNLVAEHKDMGDEGQTVVFPEAKTTATDKADGDHSAWGEKITIVDEVVYSNLIPGKEYTVSGTLHDKATGEELKVEGATATKTFTAEQANGSVELEFTIDASALIGKALVAFETVTYEGKTVAVHADINDEAQTVTIEEKPSIKTTATDAETGKHLAYADQTVTIKDVVEYRGLKPGTEYTMTGKLMVKETGEALIYNGQEVTASVPFTPTEANGTVELTFPTADLRGIAGKSLVAFEKLTLGTEVVATHEDLGDEGQTVVLPEIRTNANDPADGDKVVKPSKKTTVVDTVTYTNLIVGKEYTVSGTLMKKSDGKPLEIDGKPVTASKTFTAEKKNGTIDLEFTFDASALSSTTLVAFEKLTNEDDVVATHEDLTDKDQTVVVSEKPQIRTQAKDKADGDNVVEAAAGQVVVDTVSYTNLEKGKEYTLTGTLMDKTTGEPVMNGNNKVVATKKFTAEAETGTVDVVFNFDGTGLQSRALVVFEKLFDAEGEQVAKHENINDEAQTVTVRKDEPAPEIGTTATDSATKDHIANADAEVTIVDVVAYKNLTAGKEYTLKGQLVKKSDKAVVAEAQTTFTAAESGEGTVELSFTFDGSKLAGQSTVAFEKVFDGEELVASHEDINDADQTVDFPSAKTNATDKADGDQAVEPAGKVTIVDTVTYTNLIVGKEYTVSGTLMKKSDGKPLEAEGATATKTFTAEKKNGSVELEFTIDASALAGEKLVAFEKVTYGEEVVATHEDLTDKDQTVTIEEKPEIGTTATAEDGKSKTVALGEKVKVVDVVEYKNLKAGKEYTLSGKLVTKESQGKQVVAEASTTFKADASGNGTVELVFTVDTSALAGEKLVAFERVSFDGTLVASHEDLTDKDQTVTVEEKPEIEKYVNKNVHKAIDLNEVFTYDVIAYITKDADKAEITDTLVDDLQFVSAAADVKVVDLGLDVDHTPNGSVAQGGTAVADAKAAIDGKTLTVTLDPAKALRGHWVKVTFDAKIADGLDVKDLKYAKIEKNVPVLTNEKHEGVPNTASYKVFVGNEGKYSDESNTVTVNPAEPKIGTTATDNGDGDKSLDVAKAVEVKDVVTYEGLKAGKEYTLSGKLVTKASKGTKVVAEATKKFKASKSGKGTVELVFTVDTTQLAKQSLVAFEQVLDGDELIAKHEDITDVDQTVTVGEQPEIRTHATDKADGDQVVKPAKNVTVVDTVTYKNLIVGKEYTVSGKLMKKSDGQPLLVNGKAVTAEKTFTAEQRDGEIQLEFTFDASALSGEKLVAFEKASEGDDVVATHEDLNDEDQTVTVSDKPEIATTATDKNGSKSLDVTAGTVTVVDTVTYSNLEKGTEYTLKGTLMDKATKKAVEVGGKAVTAEKTFKAEAENGNVEMEFTFDVAELEGKTLVVFEKLFEADAQIAKHENINDKKQTVTVTELKPEIGTIATDKADGNHEVAIAEKVTIVDEVKYTNLKVGKEYTVSGTLMVKSTGKALEAEGATATKTFTPEAKNGSVFLEFTIDTTALQGEALVAFEKVSDDKGIVATHEDLNDEDQTVTVEEKPEIEKYVNRNVHKSIDLDEVFTYDVLAYITKDADKAEITDELVEDLQFVSAAADVKVADLGTSVDHKPNGSVAGEGKAVADAKAAIDGKTLIVTIDPAEALRGHWVKVTFDAKIADGKKIEDLKYAEVTENDPVLTDEKHEGVPNKASYKVYVGNKAKYGDESNTVTVNPKEPKIATTATAEDGKSKTVALGEKVKVVDVVKYTNLKANTTYTMNGELVTKASKGKTSVAKASTEFTTDATGNGQVELTFTVDTTKLQGEKLVAFEKAVEVEKNVVIATHEDLNDKDQTVTVEEKPEIEKYVNRNVHKSIDLDEVFTYDVLAYITKDADKAEITDELVEDLQFVSAAADVKVADLGTSVDHKPNGSVAQGGTAVADAKAAIDGKTLTVTIDPAKALRGHWVKVTFDAKIAEGKALKDLKYAKIEKNDPVLTDEKHEGVPNKASYKVYVGNKAKYGDESNTVTVNPKEPKIATTATDNADGDKSLEAGKVTVKDVVVYENLKAKTEYKLEAKLVTKADGGKTVVADTVKTFTSSETGNGSVDVFFEIDAAAYAGQELVAFEKAIEVEKNVVIATHEDLGDKNQTVTVTKIEVTPEIGTTATDAKDADQQIDAHGTATVNDAVDYTGFEPGKEYTLKGMLVKKSDGSVVATGEKTFTAEAEKGTETIVFTFEAAKYAGEELVAYEYAFEGTPEISVTTAEEAAKATEDESFVAKHEDINDKAQTVTVDELKPEIGTVATDSETKDHIAPAAAKRTITDVVAYEDLTPGAEYTLKGTLVKKSDGSAIATGEATFTASKTGAGEATMTFENVDLTALANDAAVAYEYLFAGNVTGKDVNEESSEYVTKHEDINDESQTVVVPEAKTNATDKADGDHSVAPEEKVTIVDTVTYTNLIAGKKYTVAGTLHVKNADGTDGGALDAEGATATKTFTAKGANGSVELEFTIDASKLAGQKVVAFEEVSYNGVVVATHADITDEDQTVVIEKTPFIGTTAAFQGTEDPKVIDLRLAPETVTVVDTVSYTDVKPGTYTLAGKLVKKADDAEAQTVIAEATAQVEANESGTGTWEVTFEVAKDAIAAAADPNTGDISLVAFEKLMDGERTVATHEDITDADQTVAVKRTAKDEFGFPVVKIDEDGKLVAGATLEVRDAAGSVIATWQTSDKEAEALRFVEVEAAGTYTVFETKAPEGYEVAEPITVEVFDGGFVTDPEAAYNGTPAVVMVDKKVPGNPPTTEPPTPPSTVTPTPGTPVQTTPGRTTVTAPTSKVTPRTTTVVPKVTTTPVRTSTRLPVTGLSKTGASTGIALGMGAALMGLGFVLVRRREEGER